MLKNLMRAAAAGLAAILALSTAACGTQGTTDSYRVAYIARGLEDSFPVWLANALKSEAEKHPDIKLDIFDSESDNDKENAFIQEAIEKKYDCIIVQPNDGEVQKAYVEKIVQAQIPVITTNPRIAGIDGASSADADPYQQAKVNCDLAVELIPQNAKVVVLTGPSVNFHSIERRRAWQTEFFDKRPDVTIVGEQTANWMEDEAKACMENWITSVDTIDAVISMNDGMCVGALEAVKGNAKFDNMLAFGVDGTAEALALIAEGRMTSTCMQNAYELAALLLDTVDKLMENDEETINVDIGNPLVTKDNVQEYIDLLK
jgi:inositol transport system substrate-binding protein